MRSGGNNNNNIIKQGSFRSSGSKSAFGALANSHHQQTGVQVPQQHHHSSSSSSPSFPPLLVVEKLKSELFSAIAPSDRGSIKTIHPNVSNNFAEAYEGQIDGKTQKRHGLGVLRWPNGNLYIGGWEQGSMHGPRGTFFYAIEMDRYDGDFANDKKHGVGAYVFANGNSYKGEFRDDKRNGTGTYAWQCGDTYEGQWVDGKMHGRGLTRYANGNTYNGDFVEDRREGYGVLTCSDGLVYDGHWHKNNRHGQGKISFPSGDFYDGNWEDDKKHGRGRDVMKNGSKFEGEYIHNVRCGAGTMVFANGDRYVGEFKDDKMHGAGRYEFSNGFVYDGEWSADMRHGHGHYTFPSGHIYDGGWNNDRRAGSGKLIVFNGGRGGLERYTTTTNDKNQQQLCEIYSGVWVDGKMNGSFDVFLCPAVVPLDKDEPTKASVCVGDDAWQFRFFSGTWTNGAPTGEGTFIVPVDDSPPALLQLQGSWARYPVATGENFEISAGDGTIYRPSAHVLRMLQATCEQQLSSSLSSSSSNNNNINNTSRRRKIEGGNWWQLASLRTVDNMDSSADVWTSDIDFLKKCASASNQLSNNNNNNNNNNSNKSASSSFQQQQICITHPIDLRSTLIRPIVARSFQTVKNGFGMQDGALAAGFESARCAQHLRDGGLPSVDEIKRLLSLDGTYDVQTLEKGVLADYAASFDTTNLNAHVEILTSLNQMSQNAREIALQQHQQIFTTPSSPSPTTHHHQQQQPPWQDLRNYVNLIQTLEQNRIDLENTIGQTKQDTIALEAEVDELKKALLEIDREREQVKSENAVKNQEYAEQQKKESDRRKQLEGRLAKAMESLNKLRRERDDAEKLVVELRETLNKLTSVESSAKETASQVREQVQAARGEVNSLTAELRSEGIDVNSNNNNNDNNSNPTLTTYSKIAELEKQIAEMKNSSASSSSSEEKKNNKHQEQQQQDSLFATIDAGYQVIFTRLNHFSKHCRGLMGALAEHEDADQLLKRHQRELGDLRLKSKAADIESLRQAIAKAQERLERLKQQERDAAAHRDARAALSAMQQQLDKIVLTQEQELVNAQNSLAQKKQTVEAIEKARNELVANVERQKKRQQDEIEYGKKVLKEKEERELSARSKAAKTNNNTNIDSSFNALNMSASSLINNNNNSNNNNANLVARTEKIKSKTQRLKAKLDKKKNTLRRLRDVAANRVADIRSSGIDDPKENRSLDATATKESLIHQCIKVRSGLMQQMKKDLLSSMNGTGKNNNNTSNSNIVTSSPLQMKKQQQNSSSNFATPVKSSSKKVDEDDDDDDEDDFLLDDDDDDYCDEDEQLENSALNEFSASQKNSSSFYQNSTPLRGAQQDTSSSFTTFAKDLLSAISADREKQQLEGRVAILESKLRILQHLESECAQIPMLEERLRAATKRL